jgi:hypothetical protein
MKNRQKKKKEVNEMYETKNYSSIDTDSNVLVKLIERIARIEECQKNINQELLKINKHLERPRQYIGAVVGVISSVSVVVVLKILEVVF